MAMPTLTAVGLGGVGLFGLLGDYRWLFLATAFVLLGLSFYLNVVKRPSRLNLTVFFLSAAFVVGSAAFNLSR